MLVGNRFVVGYKSFPYIDCIAGGFSKPHLALGATKPNEISIS